MNAKLDFHFSCSHQESIYIEQELAFWTLVISIQFRGKRKWWGNSQNFRRNHQYLSVRHISWIPENFRVLVRGDAKRPTKNEAENYLFDGSPLFAITGHVRLFHAWNWAQIGCFSIHYPLQSENGLWVICPYFVNHHWILTHISGYFYIEFLVFILQLSLPASIISQWWVTLSSRAVVILLSLNTWGHSPKVRFVVITSDVRS